MFWKLLEIISRIINARRIRHVNRVGEAATLACTDPEAALKKLAEMAPRLHPDVKSMHALTWGRILDGIGRTEEAEGKVILAAKRDPSNMHAHLELAKMAGRKFQFKNAKERLLRLAEEPDSDVVEEAKSLLLRLEDIRTGKEAKRYAEIAGRAAAIPMGRNGEKPGLPADLAVVDAWVATSPQTAIDHLDDLAMLFGQTAVIKGGKWKISLSARHSLVEMPDGTMLCPFKIISNRFTDSSFSLLQTLSSV